MTTPRTTTKHGRNELVAANVEIDDVGGFFTGTTVEAALQELGSGGGLTYTSTTVTTGNVTAASGNLYACTIAGLTADRDLNLPTPSAAGERVGVLILDGDATYELIIKANSVEITRLFIAQEYMTFVSTGTGAGDWVVEVDGRIPQVGIMERQAAQSINTNSVTKILPDTSVKDVGNVVDVSTNHRITVRRNGLYVVYATISIAGIDDGEFAEVELYLDGSLYLYQSNYISHAVGNRLGVARLNMVKDLTVGQYVELYIFHTEGASQDTYTVANVPNLSLTEVII